MRTLEDVRDRCFIDDEGHWHWRGAMSAGVPRVYAPDHTNQDGEMSSQAGRRAVYHIIEGKAIPPSMRVYGTCEHDDCLNPECARMGPMSDLGKLIRKKGWLKGNARTILNARKVGRARSLLTPELITEIMESEETGLAIAARLSLSNSTVSKVRTGQARAFQPVGGMFSGLIREAA